jgi:hypothetical protein
LSLGHVRRPDRKEQSDLHGALGALPKLLADDPVSGDGSGLGGVRRGLRLAAIFVLLVAGFVAALTLVYALPQRNIARNLETSLLTLQAESVRPRVFIDHPAFMHDDFTDAIMLDTSYVKHRESPLTAAMADERTFLMGPASKLDPDTVLSLQHTLAKDHSPTVDYAYYWHGYQVFLRPALELFPYATIRYLLMISLSLLGFFTLFAVRARAGTRTAVAMFLAFLFTDAYVVPFSLNYSSVFFVMLGSVLGVLAFDAYGILERFDVELFLVIGMLTSFFDLLTVPLITFGVPILIALILRSRREAAPRFADQLRLFVRTGLIWLLGCAGGWFMKWLIGSAVLHTDVVGSGASQFLFRVGAHQSGMIWPALVGNVMSLVPLIGLKNHGVIEPTATSVAVVLGALLLSAAVVIWLLVRFRASREAVVRALPVLLVAPLPYLWYVAANNHSEVHYWFVYRLQAMTLFALFYLLFTSIDWQRVVAGWWPSEASQHRQEDAPAG